MPFSLSTVSLTFGFKSLKKVIPLTAGFRIKSGHCNMKTGFKLKKTENKRIHLAKNGDAATARCLAFNTKITPLTAVKLNTF